MSAVSNAASVHALPDTVQPPPGHGVAPLHQIALHAAGSPLPTSDSCGTPHLHGRATLLAPNSSVVS